MAEAEDECGGLFIGVGYYEIIHQLMKQQAEGREIRVNVPADIVEIIDVSK